MTEEKATRKLDYLDSLIRRLERSQWCAQCGDLVEMLTPLEAAQLAKASLLSIYCWVKAKTIHYKFVSDGSLSICAKSLPREPTTQRLCSSVK